MPLKKKEIIPYTVSYNETAFEFIQRLAKRYGKYFFWNGSQLVFGRGNQYVTPLKEGRDFLEYSLNAYTQRQHLSYQNYYPESADKQTVKSSEIKQNRGEHIVNPFQNKAVEISQIMYPEPDSSFYFDGISDEESYRQTQKVKAHRDSLQNLVTAEAKTTNPRMRLGDIAQLLASIQDIDIKSFKEQGVPIESYLIQEINIEYSVKGYRNSFKGIPKEQKIAPHWDINAYPKAPDQTAVVVSNDDPLQMNRVKLRFPWQKSGVTTPWVQLLQGYAGTDRGMHIIPEENDEVLVCFRGGNAEVPVVTGSLYNGKNKSGYHTPDNRFKAFKTRDGEKLEMEGLTKIVLSDAKGNKLEIDIEKDILTLKALNMINILAPYINIEAEKDITIKAGNNMKTKVTQDYDLDTGQNTTIASNRNTYVSARNDMDIYGGKKIIGYSSGITEWGAASQMHIHGANSKITALNKIEYKAPTMDKLPQTENFKYGKEKQIISMDWINIEGVKINKFESGDKLNLLVYTRNYKEGEEITIKVKEIEGKNIKNNRKELFLKGIIQGDGSAILKEPLQPDPYKEPPQEKTEEEFQKENENKKKHKEWKEWEEKQWKKYQAKNNTKGFFNF